ncbi:MAG TPA: LamG-like jellyroll fold domain-containing protein [Verrucomicrobiales bacterium]|jgi:hypothetical protein|nr:LamG-like jellyroll fold domain-containing protein [Verrucomicrobiales bacterium]
MKLPSLLTFSAAVFLSGPAHAALTAAYQFNEASGNSASDAIRGATGVATLNNFGGAQWVPGKIGNALEFDGANDFALALNVIPTGTTAMTISAWVWADAAPTWGSIVKNWGDASAGSFHFGFDNTSGRISNYLAAPQAGPLIAPGILTLNAWHHVAVTYNGSAGNQTLYIDGLQVASSTAPPDLDALTPNMSIGVKTNNSTLAASGAAAGYWDGKIDDLAFWNEALSAAQILQIKNNGDAGIGVVPEPSSMALLLLGVAGMSRRRR